MVSNVRRVVHSELRRRDQWVCWNHEGGTKGPKVAGSSRRANSTDPKTWRPFEDCVRAVEAYPGRYAGVGSEGNALVYELRDDDILYDLAHGVKVKVQARGRSRVKVSMQHGSVLIPPETGDLGSSTFRAKLVDLASERFGDANGLVEELGLIAIAFEAHLAEREGPPKSTRRRRLSPSSSARPTASRTAASCASRTPARARSLPLLKAANPQDWPGDLPSSFGQAKLEKQLPGSLQWRG